MKIKISLIIIFLTLLLGQSAFAVGVGVKPKKLDVSSKVGKEIKTELLIMNVDDQPAIYSIYPDAIKEQIIIEPNDFSLDANASKIVQLKIKTKNPGLFNTNISVVARPLGATGFAAGSGVKIPLTINSSGIPFLWLVVGILLVCLLAIFAVLLIKRKNKITNLNNKNI